MPARVVIKQRIPDTVAVPVQCQRVPDIPKVTVLRKEVPLHRIIIPRPQVLAVDVRVVALHAEPVFGQTGYTVGVGRVHGAVLTVDKLMVRLHKLTAAFVALDVLSIVF